MKHTTLHEQPGWSGGVVVIAPQHSPVDMFDDNLLQRTPLM